MEKKSQASYIVMEYAPHNDLCQAILEHNCFEDDEKLVRTYFHHLIEGIEYLHTKGVAHLDIKLDNLLIGDDYQLKIADFDNSHIGDDAIKTKGTRYYRSPELMKNKCLDTTAADIYSAGVVLFTCKSGGFFPHCEEDLFEGVHFYNLFNKDLNEFWLKHCIVQGKNPKFFDLSFRSLINSMLANDPQKRATLSDIKSSKWYKGPVYTPEELCEIMKEKLCKTEQTEQIK